MKITDISIDLETLSTRSDAAIVSIGAQAFDRNTGEMGATLYYPVQLKTSIPVGHVDGGTLSWWMRQSAEARSVFEANGVPLATALHELTTFVSRQITDEPGVKVWGNGATFDISILEHAYRSLSQGEPWEFWDIRDMRTLVEAAEALGFNKRWVEFDGVAHNALADAIHQAKIISMCWRGLTNPTSPTYPWPPSGL